MKTRITLIFLSILFLGSCGSSKVAKKDSSDLQGKMIGTWKCVDPSYPYLTQIKQINETHFIWVTYHIATDIVGRGAGGTCSFEGNTYTENIEYSVLDGMKEYIGTKAVYDVRFEKEDKIMYIMGKIDNDWFIMEKWEKIESGKHI